MGFVGCVVFVQEFLHGIRGDSFVGSKLTYIKGLATLVPIVRSVVVLHAMVEFGNPMERIGTLFGAYLEGKHQNCRLLPLLFAEFFAAFARTAIRP